MISDPQKIELIPTKDLLLDERNPRLAGLLESGDKVTQENLLHAMCKQMALDELAASITTVGFYQHEPLFAEKQDDGKFVVIEGNRRLATVKLLLDDTERKRLKVTSWPSLKDESAREALRKLPVWITTREDSWQAIGFKHVNGPLRWGSYAKARYAAQLHREYRIPLDEIAHKIGDSHKTVARLHCALMVVEQAERAKIFDRADTWQTHFFFSHLYTGLQLSGIAAFIGLNEDAQLPLEAPIPKEKMSELGELLLWIYGSKKEDTPPRMRAQNPGIRQLNSALKLESGLNALRSGASLQEAADTAAGDTTIFRQSLQKAKESLERASSKVTGYKGDREMLVTAGTVFDLANELLLTLERRAGRRRKNES